MEKVKSMIKKIPLLRGIAYIAFTANKKGLLNPVHFLKTLFYLPTYLKNYCDLIKSSKSKNLQITFKHFFPVFVDYSSSKINRHYWFQDIYVASKIIATHNELPKSVHVDIGSRVEGFITSLISAKINLIFADINLPPVPFPGTTTTRIDLQEMTPIQFENVNSVSSLHVIEHLGLGKYGDKIDALGHRKVFEDFSAVLATGTRLYLSSPVSHSPGVIFNAGRHLDPNEMLNDATNNGFIIDEVAIVQDDWTFDINPTQEQLYQSEYGCLILCLTKI